MWKVLVGLILGLGLSGLTSASGAQAGANGQVELYFFWSQACPHCLQAGPMVRDLAAQHDWLVLHAHEVTESASNRALYREMAASLGEQARSVPAFIFCNRMLVGYDSAATTGALLAEQLDACHRGRLPPLHDDDLALPEHQALWLSTLTIAGLDAFNPCAFFVLLALLGLLMHAQDRRRIAIIGGIFVTTSALFYFLSMAAWLNLFLLIGQIEWINRLAGLLALLIGAVNIKDYVAFGQGPSLQIPAQAKPLLFRRMRRLIDARGLPTLILGAGTLAIVANSYELLCTAGFPMVYTRLLTLADLSAGAYYAWLAAYNAIYVIPLVLIVAISAWTLGRRTLSQRMGRLLKLISGVMMAGLGMTLVVAPTALGDPATGIRLLALALMAGVVAWYLESRQRPPS